MNRKVFDLKALDVDKAKGFVKLAFAQMETVDRDGDVFDKTAFKKSIGERGPKGSNEIWHLLDHQKKLTSALGKFSNVYTEDKYLVGENTYRKEMWLWREVAWPLYEKGDITQHSIGFTIVNEEKSGNHNVIKEAEVWEGSAVPWGAQPDTPVLDMVKSFMQEKAISAQDYMSYVLKNLREGKYSGENESLLVLELKEMSALFLPKEISQDQDKPDESPLELQKLKDAIQLITIKMFNNGY